MNSASEDRPLAGRTVLIAPSGASELKTELERHGARVFAWPQFDVRALDNSDALDESIENLFGYDWLIFRNVNAVDFFLRRFQELGHEISELDALRVCGVGEETVSKLEGAQVHVDVIPDRLSSQAVCGAIETYAGGPSTLSGFNFLIPGAGTSYDYLAAALQDAGARADLVATYRSCAANDATLARIATLLTGGGIDCIVFRTSSELREFAAVFDTNDLSRLLAGVAVACINGSTIRTATDFGVHVDVELAEAATEALVSAVSEYLNMSGK